jgi:hypothetical protein
MLRTATVLLCGVIVGEKYFANSNKVMVYFRLGKCNELECRSGEIGRRTGFKILRGQPRVGSIPTSGTTYKFLEKLARWNYQVHS